MAIAVSWTVNWEHQSASQFLIGSCARGCLPQGNFQPPFSNGYKKRQHNQFSALVGIIYIYIYIIKNTIIYNSYNCIYIYIYI